MLQPIVHRVWQGIQIVGEQVGLELLPREDGRVSVTVHAQPALTGWDRVTRVTSEDLPNRYTAGEIAVHDTELVCMAADEQMPFFRQGFSMSLEPGMAPLLRAWLPRLFDTAALASDIVIHVDPMLRAQEPPFIAQHLYGLFTCVVAAVVIDGLDPVEAIASERKFAPASGYGDSDYVKPLWDMFDTEPVLVTLQQAHTRAAMNTSA